MMFVIIFFVSYFVGYYLTLIVTNVIYKTRPNIYYDEINGCWRSRGQSAYGEIDPRQDSPEALAMVWPATISVMICCLSGKIIARFFAKVNKTAKKISDSIYIEKK